MSKKTLIDSIPYSEITEAVRKSTHEIFEVCRRKTAGNELYAFVWGADQDITSLDWRANTEEHLKQSAEKWYRETILKYPNEKLTVDIGILIQRYSPMDWGISSDIPVPVAEREFNPSEPLAKAWEKVTSSLSEDDLFAVCNKVQARLFDAIIQGLSIFDSEYSWHGIDRSRFFLSAFIWDGDSKLNIKAAKQLNTNEIARTFKKFQPA